MRPTTLGLGLLLLLAAALLYFTVFAREEAHIANLVPTDFRYGVFYSSLNDLRELYEGPYARRDFDPARRRIGEFVNAPGLDGISVQAPVGSYFAGDGPDLDEVFVVPTTDFGAYETAFRKERENLRLKAPHRVGSNYFSVSGSPREARRGPDNRLVLKTLGYPLALVGRPTDALTVRFMLFSFLSREARQQPEGLPLLARMPLARVPAEVVARECDELLIGVPQPAPPKDVLRAEAEAVLAEGSALRRAATVARSVDVGALLGGFPNRSLIGAGAALDARGWDELGLPLPLGGGALAFAIVRPLRGVARPYNLLVVAQPVEKEALARLAGTGYQALLDEPRTLEFTKSPYDRHGIATCALGEPPQWLANLLRSSSQSPAPVYLSQVVAGDRWCVAIGQHAEAVLAKLLDSAAELQLRGAEELAHHPELMEPGHVAVAFATPDGLKALGAPMPMVEVASFGQPVAVTATVDVAENEARAEIRLKR